MTVIGAGSPRSHEAQAQRRKLALFIHGWRGASDEATWGKFPDLIRGDISLSPTFDVALFSYDTAATKLGHAPPISQVAQELRAQIETDWQNYREIVIVAHSQGGLVARRYVADQIRDKRPCPVRRVLFFATPHMGALAGAAASFAPGMSAQTHGLAYDSQDLQTLLLDEKATRAHLKIRAKFVVAGRDGIVGVTSAWGSHGPGDLVILGGLDHRSIVKPQDATHRGFKIARAFLLDDRTSPMAWAELGIARIMQARTQAFRDEYLVSEMSPVPFGGRDAELDRLTSWLLDESAPPRMAITAPAGRGKSALLVQWIKSLEDVGIISRDGWQLAFMPISIRVGSNRPEIFYEGLGHRLAEITGEGLAPEALRDSENLKYAVRDQLDRIAQSGLMVLIVIDGLDEALQGSFDPAIFPPVMPPTLKVVVSARWQLGDTSPEGWLQRLRWDRNVKVDRFEPPRLDGKGIADVLMKLGAPVDALASERSIVERLTALTKGEPLLVRYYAEDLWQARKRMPVTPSDLDAMQPGFGSYFQRWLELQAKLWREEGVTIDSQRVDEVLSILAFALGPLESTDLQSLIVSIYGVGGPFPEYRILEPLRRFVLGNGKRGSGYVLNHPKIGEYLQQERFRLNAVVIRAGFVRVGRQHLQQLNSGCLKPERASAYQLQFFREHLAQVSAPTSDFMALVEDGWRCAWEHFEGGQRGFLGDVRAAWSSLQRDGLNLHLGAQWRCALVLASARSVGTNTPVDLIVAAVKTGVLSIRQAAHLAELKGATKDGIVTLVHLARVNAASSSVAQELVLSALAIANRAASERRGTLMAELAYEVLDPETDRAIVDAFLRAARSLPELVPRAEALAALAHVLGPDSKIVLDEALELANSIPLAQERVRILTKLLPIVPGRHVFEAAKAISSEIDFSYALLGLVPYLDDAQLTDALQTAKAIDDEGCRSRIIEALAPYLSAAEAADALQAARVISDGFYRWRPVAALARHFSDEQRKQVLADALHAVQEIEDENFRSNALADLALSLEGAQLDEAWKTANAISGESRQVVLATLTPRVDPQRRGSHITNVLKATETISDGRVRADVVEALAPHLDAPQLTVALHAANSTSEGLARSQALGALGPRLDAAHLVHALRGATAIGDGLEISKTLAALTPCIDGECKAQALVEAVQAAQAIGEKATSCLALAALAPHLDADLKLEVLTHALQAAMGIANGAARSHALAALAPHLDAERKHQAMTEALQAAKATREGHIRSQALVELAPHLDAALIAQALMIAKTVKDGDYQADVVVALAPSLDAAQAAEALKLTKTIDGGYGCWRALAALVPRLHATQLPAALHVAEAIGDAYWRSRALVTLVPHLDTERKSSALTNAMHAANSVTGFVQTELAATAAPHLDPERKRHIVAAALDGAKAISSEKWRAAGLAMLAPHLTSAQLTDALHAARALEDESHCSFALASLAAHLDAEHKSQALAEALDAAIAVNDNYRRSRQLAWLAPRLDEQQKFLALSASLLAAKVITDPSSRADMLLKLADDIPPPQNRDLILALIDTVGSCDRHVALGVLQRTPQTTSSIGGGDAVMEIWRTISDVSRWYP